MARRTVEPRHRRSAEESKTDDPVPTDSAEPDDRGGVDAIEDEKTSSNPDAESDAADSSDSGELAFGLGARGDAGTRTRIDRDLDRVDTSPDDQSSADENAANVNDVDDEAIAFGEGNTTDSSDIDGNTTNVSDSNVEDSPIDHTEIEPGPEETPDDGALYVEVHEFGGYDDSDGSGGHGEAEVETTVEEGNVDSAVDILD